MAPRKQKRRRFRVKPGYALHDNRRTPPLVVAEGGEEFEEGRFDLEGQRHKVQLIEPQAPKSGGSAEGDDGGEETDNRSAKYPNRMMSTETPDE